MAAPRAPAQPKPDNAPVTPRDIWDALEAAGASSVQAAAIMGNMIAESSLNPEANAEDTNGARSYGLVQWNAASYSNASSLVTGHPQRDLRDQIRFLALTGGFHAASGSTVAQAASSFAAGYERCQGCQSGGPQNTTRQANAATVASWAASGHWPASSGGGSDTATLTSAQAAQASAECAFGWGGFQTGIPSWVPIIGSGSGSFCLLSKSQARAGIGAALIVGGLVITGGGLGLVLRAAGQPRVLAAVTAAAFPELAAGRVASRDAGNRKPRGG